MSKRNRDPIPLSQRELWTAEDLAEALHTCRSMVAEMNRNGELPAPLRRSRQFVRWRAREIRDWVDAGCPPRTHWSWQPSVLFTVSQSVRMRRLELAEIERQIAAIGRPSNPAA